MNLSEIQSGISADQKKFSFADNMKFIITMGPSSIREELLHLYDYDLQTISTSAFVQSISD